MAQCEVPTASSTSEFGSERKASARRIFPILTHARGGRVTTVYDPKQDIKRDHVDLDQWSTRGIPEAYVSLNEPHRISIS